MEKRLVRDARLNTAKTRKQYEASWNGQINELTSVLLEAGVPSRTWNDVLQPLRSAVIVAANRLENEGVWD